MTQTEHYDLNKFDSTDLLETTTREGLNENADIIDGALEDLSTTVDELAKGLAKSQLNMYGGKTLAFNQIVPSGQGTTQYCTKSYDNTTNTYTLTATSFGNAVGMYSMQTASSKIVGHKYFCKMTAKANKSFDARWGFDTSNYVTITESYQTFSKTTEVLSTSPSFSFYGKLESAGITEDCTINLKNVFCIDLTKIFGAGNEPTLEQCEAIFTSGYYPYNAGELKSAQANKVTIGEVEKNIPAEVIALDGYGHSAGTVYNSVEWVDGKAYFHKRVASVDLGSLTWSTTSGYFYVVFANLPNNFKNVGSASVVANILCANYPTVTRNAQGGATLDKSMSQAQNGNLCIVDTAYSTVADFKTAMNGVMLYYELATEEVTEITSLFPSNFNIFSSAGDTSFEFVDSSIAWVIPYDVESRNKADDISYDNSASGLSATNVQEAINELYSLIQALT